MRIAVLGSENRDPGVYPTAGPCSNAPLQRNLGLCRGLKYTRCTSSALAWPLGTGDRAPPLPGPYIALPRDAPHRATRRRQEQRMRGKCICAAPAHVHLARAAFAAGAQLAAHIQPALRTGLMAPAWRLLHVSRRVIPDFDLQCISKFRASSRCAGEI